MVWCWWGKFIRNLFLQIMVVLDYICSTLGNLHCFVIAVVCFCLGAHWKIVGEGLWRHIAVEPLLPAAWTLSLLGLDRVDLTVIK